MRTQNSSGLRCMAENAQYPCRRWGVGNLRSETVAPRYSQWSSSRELTKPQIAIQPGSLTSGTGARTHATVHQMQLRGMVTVVEKSTCEAAQKRPLRRKLKRMWVYMFGNGRRKGLLTARQASWIGNSSFVLVSLSFLSTDILTLRLLNVIAGMLMFCFNAFSMERPMWISMKWGAFLATINIAQIAYLRREKRTGLLTGRDAKIYEESFDGLITETQFLRLTSEAEWLDVPKGTRLTIEGTPNEFISLICTGDLFASRSTAHLSRIGAGSWVGERGFLRQYGLNKHVPRETLTAPSFATTTVVTERACVLRWRREDLLRVSSFFQRKIVHQVFFLRGRCRALREFSLSDG